MKHIFVGRHLRGQEVRKLARVKVIKRGSGIRSTDKKTAYKVVTALVCTFFAFVFLAAMSGATLAFGYVGMVNASLPDAAKIVTQPLAQSTRIYDRNGKLLYTVFGDINREYVSIDKIPDKTKWSLLAAEDIDFETHNGIDVQQIASAFLDSINKKDVRGASTLTQQLVRNVVLTQVYGEKEAYAKSFKRKLTEILLAMQLENNLSKDQILEIQMNQVFLGGTTYGYQTAAKFYFNKDVSQLTLSEDAFLSGIIQAPAFYMNEWNYGNKELVLKRRNDVLDLMLKHADKTHVTEQEVAEAKQEPLVLSPPDNFPQAPHFVFYVIEQLEKQYGKDFVRTGGLQVKTTLDLDTQHTAENKLREDISRFSVWYGVHNGAVVVIDPRNGEVLAMVGSVDYNNDSDPRVDGKVNVAVMPRQMGSSVKPYTYMAAFEDGYTPGTIVPDMPISFGKYKPTDWDKKFKGMMTIRTAINQSRNVPAVFTLNSIGGPERFIQEAQKLGITTLNDKSQYGLSLTLGAGEMRLLEHTNAFGAFANRGVKYDTSVILEIKDNKNKVIYKEDPKKSEKRVYTEDESFLMNWVLCQMGGRLDKSVGWLYNAAGQRICGKTGTSTGPKDLLTIGYYPKLVVGVWAGNNNGQLTFGTRGQGWSENVPIVIVRDIMQDLVPRYGREFYAQPAGVGSGYACRATGMPDAPTQCDKVATVYIKSKKQKGSFKIKSKY